MHGGIEVADIFRQYGPSYRATHRLPLQQLRTMRAIEICSTCLVKSECLTHALDHHEVGVAHRVGQFHGLRVLGLGGSKASL